MYGTVLTTFYHYIGNGAAFILYAAAALYLFAAEKDRARRVVFLYFPLAIFILYFIPVFADLVNLILDDETYYRMLWLIPESLTIGYAAVHLIAGCRKRAVKVIAFALALILVIVTGDYVYDNPYFSKAENRFHVPATVAAVCEEIIVEGREVKAVFPEEMLPYVRQYTANIVMAYGRDVVVESWEIENELYDAMSADTLDSAQIATLSQQQGCHYIIINTTKPMNGSLTDFGYDHVASVDVYEIYLLHGADLSV